MSGEDTVDYEEQLQNEEQIAGGSSSGQSFLRPMAISRKGSMPVLPPPAIDETPLMDEILSSASLTGSSPLSSKLKTVEQLANENNALDQRLREMQRRLDEAQAKAAAAANAKKRETPSS